MASKMINILASRSWDLSQITHERPGIISQNKNGLELPVQRARSVGSMV